MSGSKHFNKLAWSVTAVMLVITILFMNGGVLGLEVKAHTMGYENRLFDNSRVHTIDIVMDDWSSFIDSATSEEYDTATIIIDGEAYRNVGIRGKGNTSLSTVSSLGSERYSFKIEFDHYDNSITYHGLDKLSLNNLIQDSTMMKDYLTYTMMNEFGAASPLCSFVYITVNGEDWGLYLAVEGIEDSFLERNYGSDYGELYKPDSMSFGGGRGNGMDFNMDSFINENFGDISENFNEASPDSSKSDSSNRSSRFDGGNFDPSTIFSGEVPDMSKMPEDFDPPTIFGGGETGDRGGFGFGSGMGSDDVKLQYIDDSIDSYSNIWNNAKTDITEADQYRLIESLKALSNAENIESVVNIDQVIRYFVVHNFVCNDDSYTGTMIHNYYLYEENSQLTMIPWDYNLGFGTFSASNATSTINTPIDSPVSGDSEDRPMLNWIFESDEYTALYHQYFANFLESVDITGIIDEAYQLIAPYVEKDPSKFYTYEEFELGVETIRQFCSMRKESINMQLENGETSNEMNYVDASSITLSDMGSMKNGMNRGGAGEMGGMNFDGDRFNGDIPSQSNQKQTPQTQQSEETQTALDVQTTSTLLSADRSKEAPDIPDGFGASQAPGGTTNRDAANIPEGGMMSGDSAMPEEHTPPEESSISEETDSAIIHETSPNPEHTESIPEDQGESEINNETSDNNIVSPQIDKFSQNESAVENGRMPQINPNAAGGEFSGSFTESGFNMNASSVENMRGWIWIGISALILCVGLIVAKLYRY